MVTSPIGCYIKVLRRKIIILMWYIKLAHLNIFPDWLLRLAVRISLYAGWIKKHRTPFDEREHHRQTLIRRLKASPIAIETDQPNIQHYEVPSDFFRLVLGRWMKYSCCFWSENVHTLDAAEAAMLALTCERAQIADGMHILDLGCGWGAFSMWAAQHYPHARIMALSNSRTQKAFIDSQCRQYDIRNIETITADVANLDLRGAFDRVVSIEMFEHMKNYQHLLSKIAALFKKDGKLFVHIFSNIDHAHEFDASDPNSWMAQTFFTVGLMPSDDLLLHFQNDLSLEAHWRMNGLHYTKTLNAWLERMYRHKQQILPILADVYGRDRTTAWWVNWKLFFLGCAETWRMRGGAEYLVSHYLFQKR